MECDKELYQWDDYFMDIAELTAKRSNVPGRNHPDDNKAGVVIVQDKRTISQGYNGYPAGFPNWRVAGRDKFKEVHAEANAIAWAARRGISTEGATLYTTMVPCIECAKLIIQAGIKQVYTLDKTATAEDFPPGLALLEEANVRVFRYHK
jgi:dCMP deaminase